MANDRGQSSGVAANTREASRRKGRGRGEEVRPSAAHKTPPRDHGGAQEAATRASKDTASPGQPSEHGSAHERSARILHQGHSTLKARYVQPVVAKFGNLFLLCGRDGDILGGT